MFQEVLVLTEGVRAVVILWCLVVVFCRSWAVVSKEVVAVVFQRC